MEPTAWSEEEKRELDAAIDEALKATLWRKAIAPKNQKPYYYNRVTKVTRWTLPEELLDVEKEIKERILNSRVKEEAQPVAEPTEPEEPQSVVPDSAEPFAAQVEMTTTANDVIEPVVAAKAYQEEGTEEDERRLRELLSRKDSLLDFDSIDNAKRLISVYKTKPQSITEAFVNSYVGYPQMCRILLEVLGFAQGLERVKAADGGRAVASSGDSPDAEEVVLEHFAGVIKQHFNRKQADEILAKSDQPPDWVRTLLLNDTMRATLNDLGQRHRDSAFLRHCSKEMNVLGFGNKHAPLVIAAALDGVARLYHLLSEVVIKCLSGQDATVQADELAILVRGDADLVSLARSEMRRLREVIAEKDPDLVANEYYARPSKRARTDDGAKEAFLFADRLERVLAALHKVEDSLRRFAAKTSSGKPLDVNGMTEKLSKDALLATLVGVVENGECGEEVLAQLSEAVSNLADTGSAAWAQARSYWASPMLTAVLLDEMLAGKAMALSVLCKASIVADLTPKMMDALCDAASVPPTRKECQEALDSSYDFGAWKAASATAAEEGLQAVQALFKDVSGMLYAVDQDKVRQLAEAVTAQRVQAHCFLRLLLRTYSRLSGSMEEQNANLGCVMSLLVPAMRAVVRAFPLFGAEVFSCVECMLEALPSGVDGDDKAMENARALNSATAKKDLLGVLVEVLCSDSAPESAFRFIQFNADKLDAGSIRSFMHSLLVDLKRPVWQLNAAAFVEVLVQPSVLRAISNVHFKKEGIANLRTLLSSTDEATLPEAVLGKTRDLKRAIADLH